MLSVLEMIDAMEVELAYRYLIVFQKLIIFFIQFWGPLSSAFVSSSSLFLPFTCIPILLFFFPFLSYKFICQIILILDLIILLFWWVLQRAI